LKAVDLYYLPRIFLFAFILAISPLVVVTQIMDGFEGMGAEYLLIIPLLIIGTFVGGVILGVFSVGLFLLFGKFIQWTFGLDD
jgi:hypothetical protein